MDPTARIAIWMLLSTLAFVLLLTPYQKRTKEKRKRSEKRKRGELARMFPTWWLIQCMYGGTREFYVAIPWGGEPDGRLHLQIGSHALYIIPSDMPVPHHLAPGEWTVIGGPMSAGEALARLMDLVDVV